MSDRALQRCSQDGTSISLMPSTIPTMSPLPLLAKVVPPLPKLVGPVTPLYVSLASTTVGPGIYISLDGTRSAMELPQ